MVLFLPNDMNPATIGFMNFYEVMMILIMKKLKKKKKKKMHEPLVK